MQQARVKAVELLNEGGSTSLHLSLLRDACCISLLSLVPPDRVGLIRKLRLGHTLKRREGGWRLDLTKQRDSHKTSASPHFENTPRTCPLFTPRHHTPSGRFYGPFAAALPDELNGVLNAYAAVLALEVGGECAYLFYPVRSGAIDRPIESSAYTAYVKRLFKNLIGIELAPKTLRFGPPHTHHCMSCLHVIPRDAPRAGRCSSRGCGRTPTAPRF